MHRRISNANWPNRTPPRTHIGALDGIRGMAALLVVTYHFGLNARDIGLGGPAVLMTGAGWAGVDLFFVLSGFLITGILYDTKGSRHYFARFYIRRALRIFPLYYGAILVATTLAALLPDILRWTGTHSWWLFVFNTNFIYAQKGGATTGVMTHYWTLAIEEQFYLVWPFVVWLCNRRQLIAIAGMIAITALVLRMAMTVQAVHAEAIFSLTPTRMDAMAWGALASLIIRGEGGLRAAIRPARIAILCSAAALASIFLVRHTTSAFDPWVQTAGYSLLACLFCTAIVTSLCAGWLQTIFSLSWLRWLGKHSYGLYVWHPIIGSLIFYGPYRPVASGTGAGLLIFTAVGLLNLLMAWASYRYWERPFLLLKRYVPQPNQKSLAASDPV